MARAPWGYSCAVGDIVPGRGLRPPRIGASRTVSPFAFRVSTTSRLTAPRGGATTGLGAPKRLISASPQAISRRTSSGASSTNRRCVRPWLPSSWPSSTSRAMPPSSIVRDPPGPVVA